MADIKSAIFSYEKKASDSGKKTYPVFIVHSSWPITEIDKFNRLYGEEGDFFGPIRIDRFKGEETSRTVCIFSENVYQRMLADGYGDRKNGKDFVIERYRLRDFNYPRAHENTNLFVQLTKTLTTAECRSQLTEKLNALIELGILKMSDFRVKIPLKSRETGEHVGAAFITFEKGVNVDAIALTRVSIHDSHWHIGDSGFELVNCFYVRDQLNRENRPIVSRERGQEKVHDKVEVKAIEKKADKPMPKKSPMRLATNVPGMSVKPKENKNIYDVLTSE